ncbi:uncharacterized protein BP5553_09468 [Venustampulla echinocandica]|uniref:Uncharacterized protein n=1 Tax=Venustampulla echinocandica TaxID=2656787 RepID=A0A370TCV7_9HELO|nr:uncharacterized protein BP5553_09468 [Venustampulla echinocandica]RDL32066.1 hypothetical protein BP5553_09468 [Venustampulla echinocandica]
MKLQTALTLFSAATAVFATPTPDTPEVDRMPRDMTIRDFVRSCSEHRCSYRFIIETEHGEQRCMLEDRADDAPHHSFYAVPCRENSNWDISWGWNHPDDFTVMTVVNVAGQWEAFFGYNHPNAGLPVVRYADVGPNPVQHR